MLGRHAQRAIICDEAMRPQLCAALSQHQARPVVIEVVDGADAFEHGFRRAVADGPRRAREHRGRATGGDDVGPLGTHVTGSPRRAASGWWPAPRWVDALRWDVISPGGASLSATHSYSLEGCKHRINGYSAWQRPAQASSHENLESHRR